MKRLTPSTLARVGQPIQRWGGRVEKLGPVGVHTARVAPIDFFSSARVFPTGNAKCRRPEKSFIANQLKLLCKSAYPSKDWVKCQRLFPLFALNAARALRRSKMALAACRAHAPMSVSGIERTCCGECRLRSHRRCALVFAPSARARLRHTIRKQ